MDIDDLEIALNLFYVFRNDYHYFDEIHTHVNESGVYTLIETQLIIQKLVRDGYIAEEEQEIDKRDDFGNYISSEKGFGYYITYEGILFVELGGYTHLNERIREDQQAKRDAHNLDVSLKRNQRNVNVWTVVLGVLNFIFIAATAYFQAVDRTDEELKLLREQLQSRGSERRRIETSLQELNCSN